MDAAALIPAVQLELSLGPEVLRAWTVAAPGPGEVALEVRLLADGVSGRLVGRWPADDGGLSARELQWRLELRLRAPAALVSTAGERLGALLDRGGAPLAPVLQAALEAAGTMGADAGSLDAIHASLLAMRHHAVARLAPAPAHAAARFPASMRWFVYEQVANDATGRIAQLVDTCPGLITLARALACRGHGPAGRALLRAGVDGPRRGRLLAAAAEAWSAARDPGADRAALRARIAGASPAVPPETLWDATFAPLVPEDIPRDPPGNFAWYHWQAALAGALGRLAPGRQRDGLVAFVSRHARVLADRLPRADYAGAVAELVDYLAATGRCPSRATAPERLLAECLDWHANARWDLTVPLDTPLPAGPLAGLESWELGGDRIRRLRTVGELVAESTHMRHCVASRAAAAVAGECHLFHGRVQASELTIELILNRGSRRWVVGEAAGVANRSLDEDERAVVAAWLRDVDEMTAAAAERRAAVLRGRFGLT